MRHGCVSPWSGGEDNIKSTPTATADGCGHNLLGTGALASAVAIQKWLQSFGLKGTVRYYGCPAEEGGGGKVFMARAGLYDDLDVALTWHPSGRNTEE